MCKWSVFITHPLVTFSFPERVGSLQFPGAIGYYSGLKNGAGKVLFLRCVLQEMIYRPRHWFNFF